MDWVAPAGPVYQAGTLSGNPLAVTAGLKTLEILRRPDTYERLEDVSNQLATGLAAAAAKAGVPLTVNRVGSMFTCFFKSDSVTDYASAKKADTAKFARFFRSLLDRGVYFPPSQFEAAFVSTAHTESDVVRTVEAAAKAFEEIW
jgi:glutamate-1-semialdehyde 2,1-aminomutase